MEIKKCTLKWRKSFKWNCKPEVLIIHHALHNHCTIQDVHQWHLDRWDNEPGFAYNFFIDKKGVIWEGRPVGVQLAHVEGMNTKSLGVCLEGCYTDDGNMTEKVVPQIQIDSLVGLIKKYKLPAKYHRQYTDTKDCPGKYFLTLDELNKLIKGVPNNLTELVNKVYDKGYITGKDYWVKKCVKDVDIMQLFVNISKK